MKTYGTVTFQRAVADWSPDAFVVKATPDVMIRLKRIFARANKRRTGELQLAKTLEVARDLEWVLSRWPMEMDDATAAQLRGLADEDRRREEVVFEILNGERSLELQEPAREPYDFQRVAGDLALSTGRLLLGDELGLGKSMSGLLVLRATDALPALVVTQTHLQRQWLRELEKTFPNLCGHIIRSTSVYNPGKHRSMGGRQPDVLIVNYHKLAAWADYLAGSVRSVIFDEAQEIRRKSSLKYVAAGQIADGAKYKVELTATPVYNYGGEIFNVLNVIAPDELGTWAEFEREWGGDRVRDPAALGEYLRARGLFLRRTRKDVARELPEVMRVPHTVENDESKLEALMEGTVDLADLILDPDADRKEAFNAAGNLDWRMRHATGVSKAPYVAQFVRLALESTDRLVLFGWHHDVYDIWREQLAEFNPLFYTGEESPAAKERHREAFMNGESRVLIMSLRAGAGLDGLQEAAHVAVFGELDWSPAVHDQCVGRLHRDGQTEPVVAYFLVSDSGADPVMAEVLNIKRMQSEPIRDPNAPLVSSAPDTRDRVRRLAREVKYGREQTFPSPGATLSGTV